MDNPRGFMAKHHRGFHHEITDGSVSPVMNVRTTDPHRIQRSKTSSSAGS